MNHALLLLLLRPEKVPEKPKPKAAAKKPAKKAPAKKTPAKKPAPKKKKAPEPDSDDMEESEEEDLVGDVDSDDDDDSSDEERELDMETFDTQTLVKDDADRKYLDSLPELEREAILGDRFEKLKAEQDMKKALRESK